MNKKTVMGLMSGTSLDGLDIALCDFVYEKGNVQYKIRETETISYSTEWHDRLKNAPILKSDDLLKLHHAYGEYLGELVNSFLFNIDTPKEQIDLISSHGHTIFHQPNEGLTFQLGHGASVFKESRIPVMCDFRTQDVVYGGQGAPLVPIGDRLLFNEYDYCLNIGGIANVSFEKEGQRVAWDVCPANMVLNYFTEKMGIPFDDGGQIAEQGEVDTQLLQQLNALNFYDMQPPKTLGREWVFDCVISLVELKGLRNEDVLATFVEHIAIQISRVVGNNRNGKLLLTGGGAYNRFLVNRINKHLPFAVTIPDSTLIEFKEALIFAFLGYLKLEDKINILSSVTGASKDHSAGVLFC